MVKISQIKQDFKQKMSDFHPKQSFYNKVARGPLASILTKGPLAKYMPKKKEDTNTKPELQEVNYDYHKQNLEELERTFQTSINTGLSENFAKELLIKNGPNILKPPETHLIRKIISYLTGGFCWLLWIGVIICFLAWKPIGNPPDPTNLGLAILLIIVIFLQAAFEAFQDWSSSKVMKSITNLMAADATVIRNGIEMKIPASDLVVGDLVLLTYGSKVPADLRIIESFDLKFDRSMLTGESEAVDGSASQTDESYTESKNIAFMATMITNGSGKAIVTLTGSQTMIGSIAVLTSSAKQEATTLQLEIRHFVTLIAFLSITTVTICFIVWGAWIYRTYPSFISVSSMLVNAIAILVAFIPTGLPVSVTLSLLLVARRMARNKVLVKNLTVVETLSCVNVIASDKTGTLTQNKMFVTNSAAGLTVLNAAMARRASVISTKAPQLKSALQLLHLSILCNESKFDEHQENKPVNEKTASGGATDIAILKYGANVLDIETIESKYVALDVIPFNSRNKWMARVFKVNQLKAEKENFMNDEEDGECFDLAEDECIISMKGAPDILIRNCKSIINNDGSESELNDESMERLKEIQNDWCLLGQRVLLICKKKEKIDNVKFTKSSDLEHYLKGINDFCIVGMVGIIDKPRDGIDEVIRTCRQAGVRIFMVTGDFSVTAAAIASQIGIFSSTNYDTADIMKEKSAILKSKLSEGEMEQTTSKKSKKNKAESFKADANYKSLLLTGTDLDEIEDDDWRTITKYEEIVFARTTPSQKLRVVEEFKKDKNIVAVTGDGVNDSPALKAANIGIAMGGGSEVAMEAAQMVLMDNSFNSMVIAIENGRLLFNNLRKVILYLLPAGSFSEVVPIILNIYFGVPMPLSAFQMICICVITDLGPSLAMMLEKSEGDLLKKPPRVLGKDRLVDKKLLLFAYFFLGVFESFFSNFMFFLYMYMHGNFTPSQVFLAYDKWTDGYLGRDQATLDRLVNTGQTVTFATLVMIQTFGNVFITRTRKLSLLQSLPFLKAHRNLWLFLAQASSVILMIIIIYVPFINNVFKTAPIPVEFYFIPLAFCVVFVALDEIRKLLLRKNVKLFVKTAW